MKKAKNFSKIIELLTISIGFSLFIGAIFKYSYSLRSSSWELSALGAFLIAFGFYLEKLRNENDTSNKTKEVKENKKSNNTIYSIMLIILFLSIWKFTTVKIDKLDESINDISSTIEYMND